jgi:hypothetical protein
MRVGDRRTEKGEPGHGEEDAHAHQKVMTSLLAMR